MSEPFRVVTVCTANQCRSPMMQIVLDTAFGRDPWAEVTSAGTDATEDGDVDPKTLAVLTESGYEVGELRTHRLDVGDLGRADLVLAAAASHRAKALRLWPAARDRIFTLSEFAVLLAAAGPPEHLPDLADTARSRVRIAAGLRGQVAATGMIDLRDPVGRPLPQFRRCLQTVTDRVEVIAPGLAG